MIIFYFLKTQMEYFQVQFQKVEIKTQKTILQVIVLYRTNKIKIR